MISYIFQNKTKNILAIVFTVGYIFGGRLLYNIYTAAMVGGLFALRHFVTLLSYLLILLYLCTLTRRYPLKNWLFPAAFAIQICSNVYAIIISYETVQSLQEIVWVFCVTALNSLALLARIFCFIGSIRNFKQVVFLHIGILMLGIQVLLSVPLELMMAGGVSYVSNSFFEYLSLFDILGQLQKTIALLLFYFGIFFLTLNKKGPDIDITPYIEARKAKKAAKQAAKLREEIKREAPPPIVPNGHWRCMGCGEILSNEINECTCGYKK